jgi:hypothetical protein
MQSLLRTNKFVSRRAMLSRKSLAVSANGLGRVETAFGGSPSREPGVSGCDRSDQRPDPDDVHDPCQIIGQHRECHFSGYFWKRFGEEVCRSHAGLHRAEGMLDCLATLAHRFRVCIEALLHSLGPYVCNRDAKPCERISDFLELLDE